MRKLASQTWSALCPDLSRRNWETDTTFRMLANAILLFGMVLAIYGAGAGIMRTVWLYDHIRESPRWIGAAGTSGAACAVECTFVRGAAIVLFTAVQIARGISALLAIALAAAIVGGAL